jgi:hypothetical protein
MIMGKIEKWDILTLKKRASRLRLSFFNGDPRGIFISLRLTNPLYRHERLMMLYITISHKAANTAVYGLPHKCNGVPLGYSLSTLVHN